MSDQSTGDDSLPPPKKTAVVVWEDGAPCFIASRSFARLKCDCLVLFFGNYCDGLAETCNTSYAIFLTQQGSEWAADLDLIALDEPDQKAKVDALLAELTAALRAHRDFDFAEYLAFWEGEDPFFSFLALSTVEYPQIRQHHQGR